MAEKVIRVKLNDGNLIPVIGFGTYGVTVEDMTVAIDAGYRHFDCADFYQNEKEVGKSLLDAIDSGKVKREELFIVSKVWPTWHSKGRPTISAKRTLKNLGLGYLDLLLIHWPMQFKQGDEYNPTDADGNVILDQTIDLVDIWREFEDIQRSGLTRSIGVSNFNSEQLERLIKNSSTVPAVNQVECHPYLNQSRLLDFCLNKGIALVAYAPLAKTGPGASAVPPIQLPLIKGIAEKYGVSPAQVIFRWQIQRRVIVIPKSSTEKRIIVNINVFDFKLTDEEVEAINGLDVNHRCHPHTESGIHRHKSHPFNIAF